jgi:hypothetical protein
MRQQPPRSNQNWILDNFLKLSTNEDMLHPGILGLRLERGFKHRDMEEVFHAVSARRALPKAWSRVAMRQEKAAEKALAGGRRVTAAQFYHRAMLYFGRSQHLIPVDGHPKKIEYYDGVSRCRSKFIQLMDGMMSKQDIPFEAG